ncbi:UDP-glucose 6-dehydrogenase AglM [Natronobiforma cellulositropha]|uniref:UDP-glucose 6-dehydrogenase AglM n=1 Tax=Natronobiforma cellulositropha TaxID=1679076 RepID=UPI0021D5FB0F|nr:UDP-glucose 6-dehydrogenase AglM [Natronobiforma cellulositropha]
MHVSIVGSGYVGTTVAACLAELGHEVVNVEIDDDIVEAINAGETPIHEPGLADLLADHAGSRLRATTDYDAVVDTDLTVLCLPTPQDDDGALDLEITRAGARSLGEALAATDGAHLVVVKSTVLPGTTEGVVGSIVAETSGKRVGEDLHLAMNPEFLRMSTAVTDFLEPDKVVLGTETDHAGATLRDLYAPILERPETHLVETGIREAELIKYANNAFLAAKVSLANELGNVSKAYGADAYEVLEAVGLDDRISARFLRSGLGWGGSCFPKDVNALRAGAREQGYDPELLDAVVAVNDRQPVALVDRLEGHLSLEGARVAVLGLAFKPGTDDVRASRALDVIEHLRERGASVVAYDPVAMENVRTRYPALEVEYAESAAAALEGADACVVATDWPAFDDLAFDGMARRIVVDGRRIAVDEDALEVYEGLTW